jgi:hypothetical protein
MRKKDIIAGRFPESWNIYCYVALGIVNPVAFGCLFQSGIEGWEMQQKARDRGPVKAGPRRRKHR